MQSDSNISLKIAVTVLEIVENNIEQNYQTMLEYIDRANEEGVGLILFPEAILTGIDISDDYQIDKEIAITIDSDYINQVKVKAKECEIWVSFGFIEIDKGTIFDSAVLINANGEIALHHRRISKGWRHPDANPLEYGCGDSFPTAMSPWGKIGFLICGDLFDVPELAIKEELDVLLFPFARCFTADIVSPQEEWDKVEWIEYSKQIKSINAYTLMTNYILKPDNSRYGNNYFGGGFITDRKGSILTNLPLNKEGLLIWDGKVMRK